MSGQLHVLAVLTPTEGSRYPVEGLLSEGYRWRGWFGESFLAPLPGNRNPAVKPVTLSLDFNSINQSTEKSPS